MRIRLRTAALLASPLLVMTAAAYIRWGLSGLPALPPETTYHSGPIGFPAWLRVGHYLNFLFIVLLVRSGLQILMDHPRLYWNVDCTPDSEWLRLTPVKVPLDRVWTAKDDSRYLTPWIGLPGGRHTVGMARHWHFASVLFWIANGVIFVALLFATNQWQRLAPTSWQIVPDAWSVFVHYATFHMPAEPDGFYRYNALQQLAYFGVVFGLAPLTILTGLTMSPALTNRFKWYPRFFGNRQAGRSLHFLIMCGYVSFLGMHVMMVVITGFARNMNHIVVGTDDGSLRGLAWGAVGIGVIVLVNVAANWLAWRHPRLIQHAAKRVVTPVMRLLFDHTAPRAEYTVNDISPYYWANGLVPTCDAWKNLAAGEFADYRLEVSGLVEEPALLSLEDLRALGKQTQITLHNCIQGWSGIAEWGGLPVAELMRRVRPTAEAKAVVFYSYGEGGEGGEFYDSLSLENAQHPQTLLAYEMNFEPLTSLHGAPLRLRVENQLGFKMVKWIRKIEFVADVATIREGEGGYNEDREYYGELAEI
jgi:DMSO/TMAO reductase YedYZ molybdopterin-dependent catalytic subunit/thiosulfate reductase cytochrome b subunit